MDTIKTLDKLRCAERELALRKSVYPKWIGQGRMSEARAAREIALMEAIVSDYESMQQIADAAARKE